MIHHIRQYISVRAYSQSCFDYYQSLFQDDDSLLSLTKNLLLIYSFIQTFSLLSQVLFITIIIQ